MIRISIIALVLLISGLIFGQDSCSIAFYNVENLFDTVDQIDFADEYYTPESDLNWDTEKYTTKIERIATVFQLMKFPDIIGLAEVENIGVLKDLTQSNILAQMNYGIVHFETNDFRGIDCALIYRKDKVELISAQPIPIEIADPDYTGRDALEANVAVDGHAFTVIVVHWPSRSGGLQKTDPRRWSAARQIRNALYNRLDGNHVLLMGDFNDEPFDISIKDSLGASIAPIEEAPDQLLYNMAVDLKNDGMGTYNYRGNWNLLDQIIASKAMADCSDSFCVVPMSIFKHARLIFKHPRFGEIPNRTSGGPNYYGGYSDHLPIYTTILLPE